MKSQTGTYRRLLGYAFKYPGRLAIGLVAGILFGGSVTALLVIFQKIITVVFQQENTSWTAVVSIALLLPVAGLIRGLGQYFSILAIHSVGFRVVTDLRDASFDHLQKLSLGYFSKQKAGDIISRVANDTTIVQQAVSTTLGDLVRQPFVLLGALGYVVYNFPKLSVIVFVVVPACVIPVVILGKKVKRYSRQNQEKLAGLMSVLTENIGGVDVVRAFGSEEVERGKFQTESLAVYKRLMKMIRYRAMSQPIMELLTLTGLALALLWVFKARMPIADFLAFTFAVVVMYEPIKKLSRIHMAIQNSNAAAERVFELLDTPRDITDDPNALELDGPIREIGFENVGFSYGEGPVLDHINIDVAQGQCIALVGGSGSGKTTLVSLLPRFYDVVSGQVTINGRDIRQYSLASLRSQIGVVSQNTFLFHDTIRANIAYGSPDTQQPNRERVEEAARRANAHDFIVEMPEGYDTVIGDKGVRLSGGQRQRLAIARALYRNAPILILDEATNALDTEAERAVQAAIDTLMAGRTVFAIAHRLSTIQNADQILVLKEGIIIEEGTHDELLAKSGHYKYLHNLQFQSAPDDASG